MTNVRKADRRAPLEVFYCVVCAEPIPTDRLLRKAVTCSKQHGTILKNERRKLRDLGRCRFCGRPSTPEERAAFAAWRKTLPDTVKRGRPSKPKPAATKKSALANGAGTVEDIRTSGNAAQEERNGIVG
jgi:predicted nucleic acid-binding Zn ribbon protein